MIAKMCCVVWSGLCAVGRGVKRGALAAVAGGAVVVAAANEARADIVITPAVDLEDYVTPAVTALGTVIAAVVLAWIGFLVVRKGMRWIGARLG